MLGQLIGQALANELKILINVYFSIYKKIIRQNIIFELKYNVFIIVDFKKINYKKVVLHLKIKKK